MNIESAKRLESQLIAYLEHFARKNATRTHIAVYPENVKALAYLAWHRAYTREKFYQFYERYYDRHVVDGFPVRMALFASTGMRHDIEITLYRVDRD
jgi:hypothetical protein